MIDWTNPESQVTEHFTVKDCLWLDHWKRLAGSEDGLTDELISELIDTCHMAEDIRAILERPMQVTSMYRPGVYSPIVGGSPSDVHTQAIAVDFIPIGMAIEDAKAKIRPLLSALEIRMEKGTTTWIHIDRHAVGPSGREFVP
jgi:hypothetical protein